MIFARGVGRIFTETGILVIAGPNAQKVLQSVSEADLSNEAFGWLKAHEIEVAGIQTIALRMSFTGELAWELHAPQAELGVIWDALWLAGEAYDMVAFGSKAVDLMRMEKAYRGGHELANDATPLHTDQMRFVKKDMPFIGKEELERLAEQGVSSQIVYLELEALDVDPMGTEAVFMDGELVGSVSSGAISPVTWKSLAFAYVRPDAAVPGTRLTLMILGEERTAVVLGGAVYDVGNERLKTG